MSNPHFGVAGSNLSANGPLGKLGLPRNVFTSGQFPTNPCYSWSPMGWDAASYNLFMYRSGRGDSLSDLNTFLGASGSGASVMFGNEPDITYASGQDGQTPRQYVDALRTAKNTLSGKTYLMLPASISQSPNMTWTPERLNPYVGGLARKVYMWDVLTYYAAQEGAELDVWLDVLNLHAYGSNSGNAVSDVQALIDILNSWHDFYSAYDATHGTNFASKPVFISELAYDVWTGQSDSYKRSFTFELYNRLRSNSTSWGSQIIAWAAFMGPYDAVWAAGRTILDSAGNLTEYGKEYRIMANCAQCRAYSTSTQSCSTGSLVVLNLNAEEYDNDGMHNNSTNNSRVTIQTAGLYHIEGAISYTSNATGGRSAFIKHTRGGASKYIAGQTNPAMNTNSHVASVSTQYQMEAGDYVELVAYQTSGSTLDSTISDYTPRLSVARIGPTD